MFTLLSCLTARLAELDCCPPKMVARNDSSLRSEHLSQLLKAFQQAHHCCRLPKYLHKTSIDSKYVSQHCTSMTQDKTEHIRQELSSITVTASNELSLDEHLRDCPRLRDR